MASGLRVGVAKSGTGDEVGLRGVAIPLTTEGVPVVSDPKVAEGVGVAAVVKSPGNGVMTLVGRGVNVESVRDCGMVGAQADRTKIIKKIVFRILLNYLSP